MADSNVELLATLFAPADEVERAAASGKKGASTVLGRFRSSLRLLFGTLQATDARCARAPLPPRP